jgi:hypothetical protein
MSGEGEKSNSEMNFPKWPEPGDKLFMPGNGRTVAHLGYRGSFSAFAIAYKDAADALVERVLEKDFGADLQFYPIAFLYRHYLELRLKQLLISGGRVVFNESKFEHGHDLKKLWLPVRQMLESVWPDTYISEMDTLGKCIDELCSFDAESMSFRYPQTKSGQPTLPGLDRVDLENLKNVMDRVGSFLDCAGDALGAILDSMPNEEYY